MVARTVSKAEARDNKDCQKAIQKEWDKLEQAKVWLKEHVREWKDVKEEARREGKEIHVGSLHELIVEKAVS